MDNNQDTQIAQNGATVGNNQLDLQTPLLDRATLEESYGDYVAPGMPMEQPTYRGQDNNYPDPRSLSRGSQGSEELLSDQLERSVLAKIPTKQGGSIVRTLDEVSSNRFDNFVPGNYNNEDAYGQNQSFGSKMVSGVGKGLLLTGTTFLQGTVGLVNGLIQWGTDGKFSSFYNNEFNRQLDELNKSAEDYMPNYYTDVEKNADWYSPDYFMTGNFLWDGVVKNMGFAAGAYLTGGVYSAGLKGLAVLPGASRLLSMGRAAEAVAASEEALIGLDKGSQAYGKIKQLSDGYLRTYNVLDKGHRAVVAGLSTSGEAGFEAYNNLNDFRNSKIEQYKNENGGIAPTGADLEKINRLADQVGNSSFLTNVALLSATNYIQFPKILGSSYSAEKGIMNNVTREIGDITVDATGKFAAKTSKNRILSGINKVRPYIFSTSEAFEEGAQYAIQVGSKDYYNKKYNNQATDWLDAVSTGISETLSTNEGAKNILIGGLSGAIMMGRGTYNERVTEKKNTTEAIEQFNKFKLSDFTKETIDAVNRGTVLQEERETLLKQGNITDSKDKETDYIINYLTPRIKYGRFDLVTADIEDSKKLASTDEGFNELVKDGKALVTDTKEAYLARLVGFEQTANNIKSLYQSLSLRYGGQVNEKNELLYTPAVMDKLIYAATKISDYESRIQKLSSTLPASEFNIQEVIADIRADKFESYENALLAIENNININDDQKEDLIVALNDVGKMAIKRDILMKEYNDIKAAPLEYQSQIEEDVDIETLPKETIKINTKSGEKDIEIGTEYFLGKTVYKSKEGKDVYRMPRFTVIGVTEDDQLKIKDKNGEIRTISPDEFESYKVAKVSDVKDNKKANFFLEHWNTVYEFNFGKGNTVKGRLEYSNKDKVLTFVYLNKKGERREIEVTGDQFVAKKDFKQPMIKAISELSPGQQKSLEDFTSETDLRISAKRESRLKILNDLFDEVSNRQNKTSKLIEQKTQQIDKIKEELEALQKEIADAKINERVKKTVRFKTITKKALDSAMRLSRMETQIVQEIEELKAVNEDLDFNLSYISDMVENIDDLPTDSREFLSELKEQKNLLEDTMLSSGIQINTLSKILKATQDALKSAIDYVSDLITRFENKYPNVPRVMGQNWIDFIKQNPNFLKLQPNYKEELQRIDDEVGQMEDLDIIPGERTVTELTENIQNLYKELEEVGKELKARELIITKFEEVAEKYKQQKLQEKQLQQNEQLLKEFLGSHDVGNVINDFTNPNYEAASKKDELEVVSSTSAVSARKNAITGEVEPVRDHHARSNRFGFKFNTLPNKDSIRGIVVTSKTEEELGMPGLTEHLFPGATNAELESIIAFVIVEQNKNGTFSIVDENGVALAEGVDKINNAIYQTFPLAELTMNYGPGTETMFREGSVNEVELKEKYSQWRTEQLQATTLSAPETIKASFGIPDYVTYTDQDGKVNRDTTARVAVEDAGLITSAMLDEQAVIIVAKTNESVTNGSVTFKTPLGRVFLKVPGGMVKLFNRKFTSDEAGTIYDVIHQLTVNALEDESLKTERSQRLMSWLKSTIYWGIPKNTQTNERKVGKYNSIWFEEIVDDAGVKSTKLFISGNGSSFEFSPSALENNKADILLLLENMYSNTNATLLNDKSYLNPYYEITGILADGNPVTKKWANYQTYLLSSEGRKVDEIPLVTQLVPIKGTEKVNRKGIYFTRNSSSEEFFIPEKAPVIEEAPVVTPVITETTPVVTDSKPVVTVPGVAPPSPVGKTVESDVQLVLDGVAQNTMSMSTGGDVTYTFDQSKAAELLKKSDPDTLVVAEKKLAFISKLIETKILNISYPEFVRTMYMDFSGKDESTAGTMIILGVFKRVSPSLIAETIPIAPPLGPVAEVPVIVEPLPILAPPVIEVVEQNINSKIDNQNIEKEITNGNYSYYPTNKDADEKKGVVITKDNYKEAFKADVELGDVIYNNKTNIITGTPSTVIMLNIGEGASLEMQDAKDLEDFSNDIKQNETERQLAKTLYDSLKSSISQESAVITEEVPVVKKPSSFANRKRGNKPDDKAYRSQLVKEAKKFQGENWTKVESFLKQNFPHLPVYRVKNVIEATNGRQAWGMLHEGAIYLYENAEVGTAYHEVFEGVWKMFATAEEKAKIVEEFKNRTGSFTDRFTGEKIEYKTATPEQIKEELAEQFRDRILGEPAEKSWIDKLFSDIINFFKTFFTGEKAQVNTQELFDKIGNGFYSTYNPYVSKLSYANIGIQDIDNVTGNETSEFRILTIPAQQQHEIMQQMTFSVLRDIVKTNKSLFSISEINLSRKDVYAKLQEDVLAIIGEQGDIIEEAVANNEITAKEAALKYNNIEALYNSVIEEWDEITKKHLEQLASYNISFNEDDEIALTDDEKGKEDPYGSPLKIDAFRKANNAVKLLLASLPYTDANGKLVRSSIGGAKLMPADEVYIMLKNKLFDSVGIDEMFDRLADIAKGNPNYANLYRRLVKNNPSEAVDFQNIDDQGLQLIASFYKSIKGQNPDALAVYILPSGEIIIGDSSLAGAARQAKREMMNSIISKIKGGLNYFIYDKERYKSSEVIKNLKLNSGQLDSYVNFLKALDINFDIRDLTSGKLTDRQLGIFRSAVEGIRDSFSQIEGMVTISSNTLSIDGRLLTLGTIKAILENPSFESTYFSISGERSQTFIGTNTMSGLYDVLSKARNIEDLRGTNYEYLLTDVFTSDEGSVMLNKLFNISKGGARKQGTEEFMKPVYIDGTVNEVSGKKKQSSKLTERERIIQEMNLNLEGVYMNLVPGDASLEWGARMHDRESAFINKAQLIEKEHLQIFKNYFIAEVKLARDKRNVVGKNKSTDLRFFKSMLGDALNNEIVSKANAKKSAETLYNEYSKEINNAVETFIKNETEDTQLLLRRYGIIKYTEEGLNIDEIAFDNKNDITEEFLKTNIKVMTINYMIANIEYHKLVYSDPYQYKDELKRIKNFNSPRQPLVWGSKKINQAFNKLFNKGYNDKNDIGFSDMDRDHFRAITLIDVLSKYDVPGFETEDLFEETDGGGYITLKGSRILKLRAGDWTEGNEKQYRYDIAFEKRTKGLKLSALEKQLLKGINPNVKSTYTPLKPIVSGGKDSSRGYNDVVLDKFALIPLSFRILYEMNPDSNAINLYNKMQKEDVDYAVYASGRKVGAEVITNLYNEDGSFNETPFENDLQINNPFALQGITKIPFAIMGIQAEVPSKNTNDVTQGSQITKLATMDFLEARVPIDFEREIKDFETRFAKWIALSNKEKQSYNNGNNLYNEINNNQALLEARIEQGYETLLKKLGLKKTSRGFQLEDRTKLINTLRNEIIKREINDNVSEAFLGFEKGDVVLEATPAYQQIRNILYSIADKNVVHPKITGGMKVQVPSTLLESVKAKPEIINGKPAYTSDILKFYKNKDGERVCEIMVARWFKSNKSDEELLNEWYTTDANGNKTLTAEGRKVLSGIGFRIPTQKQNSIDSFIIAKLLPRDFGDSVIIPSALVKKVGSDFDIDKLSIYLKNVFTGIDGKTLAIPYFGIGVEAKAKIAERYDKGDFLKPEQIRELKKELSSTQEKELEVKRMEEIFGESWTFTDKDLIYYFATDPTNEDVRSATIELIYKKSLENEYIQSLQNLVSHELNFDSLVKPNSAEDMKNLAKEINKELDVAEIDYSSTGNMLRRSFMTGLRQAFVSGKYAIGIAAVGQTNHAQNQRSVVFIDDEKIFGDQVSDADKKWLYDGQIKFKNYNSIIVNGKKRPTLSMIKNQAGEYISDIIGQFIDGYVDISKGPWIMQLGATPNIASTWLFLLKLGIAKEDVAYFMNQPIIRGYLRTLENSGYSWLFIDKYVDALTDVYAPQDSNITVREIPNTKGLKANISKDISIMTDLEKAEQQFILKEFLKYAKMASHLFDVTQGSNFDTATFNDPFLIFKKQQQLIKARKTIISSVDDILENSFVGKIKDTLNDVRDAFSEVLISDKASTNPGKVSVRQVLETTLLPFISESERSFVKISQKAVADLFDWAVQTDIKLNTRVASVLLGTATTKSVAEQIVKYRDSIIGNEASGIPKQENHPLFNNMILNSIKTENGANNNKVNNVYLTGRDNKVYDQNLVIAAFRELKQHLGVDNKDLYGKLVRLAVIQSGLTNSKIAFTNLLPYEDFTAVYNKTLSNLENLPNLADFYLLGVFQRTNWNNSDIVSFMKEKITSYEDFRGNQRIFKPNTETMNINLKTAMENDTIPKVIKISKFSQEGNNDYVVFAWEEPVVITEEDKQNKVTTVKQKRALLRKNGDRSHQRKALMKKVYTDETGKLEPVVIVDRKGNKEYYNFLYKAINAWGDSFKAQEYYGKLNPADPTSTTARASVLDNDFIKVNEVEDAVIVAIVNSEITIVTDSNGLTPEQSEVMRILNGLPGTADDVPTESKC